MWGNDERPDDDGGESALDAIREDGIVAETLKAALSAPVEFCRIIRAAVKNQEDD